MPGVCPAGRDLPAGSLLSVPDLRRPFLFARRRFLLLALEVFNPWHNRPQRFSSGRRLLRHQIESAEAGPGADRLRPASRRRPACTRKTMVFAAPVALDRQRTPSDNIRAIGRQLGKCENACTGTRGDEDAGTHGPARGDGLRRGRRASARAVDGDQSVYFCRWKRSPLAFKPQKRSSPTTKASLIAAARGMLTTDTTHKLAGRQLTLGGANGAVMWHGQGRGYDRPAHGDHVGRRAD